MPNSYTNRRSSRPARYRTPSPPWDAVEPISPIATNVPDRGSAEDTPTQSEGRRSSRPQPGGETLIQNYGHRSSGSMEIFADIALSVHPEPAYTCNYGRKRTLNGVDIAYSPSKRSKSEKLPSPELSRTQIVTATRPATSHEQASQCRMMDAELLLNFSHAARLTCASPKALNKSAGRRASPAQPKATLDPCKYQPLTRQVKKNSDVAGTYLQQKDGFIEPDIYLDREDYATIDVLSQNGISQAPLGVKTICHSLKSKSNMPSRSLEDVPMVAPAEGPNKISKQHNGPRALMVNAEKQHISSNIGSLTSQESLLEGLANYESRELHKPLSGGSCSEANMNQTVEKTGAVTGSRTVNISQQSRKSDPAINIENVENENSRSAAFCAACKFQRNQSCAEVENNATSWISCDGCKAWFHFACAGFKNEREVRAVDKFRCKKCKPIFGATTYVRKSSRAHSAIDYAGLHQGVIKTSDERMEHHYIQPIKDGVITFLPENFARMRPELVTAEFFAKNGGMKEPVIIPADLNPRPPSASTADVVMMATDAEPMELSKGEDLLDDDSEHQFIPDEGQDALDMVIPQRLTVRRVAELYGPEEKVEVIDVKSQNGESKKWNMRRWADYYENPNNKVVRNVISLEVSQSKLGRLIRRPKIVRDLDLQDAVWPEDLLEKGEYPRVQFYCLMSVADCFTDFHIDFGGSSVFYHILQGKKTFLFIPPKEKHLKKYEEWCMSPAQNWTFLADQTKECYRVDLSEGDTMLIPSGWIHAVWTPEDSLVIGGNFLTRMNFGMQLRIAQVEKATGVARKFRYPHFQKLHWYTAFQYMDADPLPDDLKEEFYMGEMFLREQPIYYDFDAWGENSRPGRRNYNARYYSQGEIEGLRDLTAYLLRTVLIDLGLISEGITTETRNAVKKSIPRSHGEPLDIVKNFAAWCTWKRGNELLHHWAYPGAKLEDNVPPEKLSMATVKKLDREAAKTAALCAPRRQSARRQSLQSHVLTLHNTVHKPSPPPDHREPDDDVTDFSQIAKNPLDDVSKKAQISSSVCTGAGPNRKTACESCRKRRRACKHKDQISHFDQTSNILAISPQDKTVETKSTLHDAPTERPLSIDGVILPISQASPSIYEQDDNSSYETYEQLQDRSGEANKTKDERADALGLSPSNTGLSRPRTKACNDCRKSKRRCIHDAFGNEDPVKVAEQVIPRPHARKSHKSYNPQALLSCLPDQRDRPREQPRDVASSTNKMILNASKVVVAQHPPDCFQAISGGIPRVISLSRDSNTLVPQTSPDSDAVQAPSDQSIAESPLMEAKVQHDSRVERQHGNPVPREAAATGFPPAIDQAPPSLSLISPPASSNDDIGNSPINSAMLYSPSPPPVKTVPSQARKEMPQRCTPESGSLRRASSSSFEQRRQDFGQHEAKKLSMETPRSEMRTMPIALADQESLRLIKELQVQEYGLRKRGKS